MVDRNLKESMYKKKRKESEGRCTWSESRGTRWRTDSLQVARWPKCHHLERRTEEARSERQYVRGRNLGTVFWEEFSVKEIIKDNMLSEEFKGTIVREIFKGFLLREDVLGSILRE